VAFAWQGWPAVPAMALDTPQIGTRSAMTLGAGFTMVVVGFGFHKLNTLIPREGSLSMLIS
ncbi:hypothetical protein, partial [uncultured Ellagibacter sp.]|uniref:hypothetical protein n=1 Tax=uncultured Ellagibacter sp. TaxID=2137580 RepID=UPI0026135A02